MSILTTTLREERQTLQRLKKKYINRLDKLPKGSFFVREKGAHRYAYLTQRKAGHVVQEYLGKLSLDEIDLYRDKMKKKKQYKQQLKSVHEQLRIVERALRGTST
jgi:hypothetical protein